MDSTPRELGSLVLEKIQHLGDARAAEYFEVSESTIRSWRTLKTFPSLPAVQKCWDESLACQNPELWGGDGNVPVMIGLPIYRYQHPMNHVTLFINYKRYGPEKVTLIPKLRTLIDEARNDLADRFLASNSEWLVMCDEDQILPIGNAAMLRKHGWPDLPEALGSVNALTRIMSHPKEYKIVGAMYRDRRTGTRVQCAKGFGSPQDNARLLSIMAGKTAPGGLEDAGGWIAPGFSRWHRSVFEEMKEAAKPGGPLGEIAPPPPPRDKEPYGFFGRTSKWRGEDVACGRRAEAIGIKSWIDTGLYVGHCGDRVL